MQSNSLIKAPPATSSLTALSVASAFMRSLDTDFLDWFDQRDLAFTKKMVAAASAENAQFWKWGVVNGFNALPYVGQRMFFSHLVVYGYDTRIAARKRMLKEHLESGIEYRDIKRVIFIGGGYDIRALVSSIKYSNVKFIEIDRGETRKIKMRVIDNLASNPANGIKSIGDQPDGTKLVNENLYYVNCDLSTTPLEDALNNAVRNNNKAEKTLVIAEGLTMYLSDTAMQKLMQSLSSTLSNDDEVMMSFHNVSGDRSRIASTTRSMNSETYQFALPTNKACEFANAYGFEVAGKTNPVKLYSHAGNSDLATYFAKNPNAHLETYFYFRRNEAVRENRQDDVQGVPDIKLRVAAKAAPNKSYLSCDVL